ncbi:MAG: response regulator transcription factor [Siphonobacter aquaeclarae]|nr:response regulator transcription factor [Siphonobacter aquaeclarae]
MIPIRCLLVDDEPPALDVIESYLDGIDGFEIVGKCANAVEAFRFLQNRQVDLLFLDIQMPKLLGTDFLRSLPQPPKVIFTTAHREYALDGFDLNVVDYLLKPIAFDRFLKAIAKVVDTPVPPPAPEREQPISDAFLYFRADRRMVKVFVRDILYIESLKDYVRIVLVQGKPIVVKQAISSLESTLPGRQFIRIHRSFIVAIDKVTAYTPTHLEISGTELPVGRLFQKEVARALAGI